MNAMRHHAAMKAAETKGAEERNREALMAAWTRKYGRDDKRNPYSMRNYVFPSSLARSGRPGCGLGPQPADEESLRADSET